MPWYTHYGPFPKRDEILRFGDADYKVGQNISPRVAWSATNVETKEKIVIKHQTDPNFMSGEKRIMTVIGADPELGTYVPKFIGVHETLPLIAMEYVDGPLFLNYYPPDEKQAVIVGMRILKMIRKLKEVYQFWHGDLHTENIMIRKSGEPVLIDFEVADIHDGSGKAGDEEEEEVCGWVKQMVYSIYHELFPGSWANYRNFDRLEEVLHNALTDWGLAI